MPRYIIFIYIFYIMQSNQQPQNLQPSYRYQMQQSYNVHPPQKLYVSQHPQQIINCEQMMSKTIKPIQGKIQHIEGSMKNKEQFHHIQQKESGFTCETRNYSQIYKPQLLNVHPQNNSNQQQLRGSFSNFPKKFDFTNLRSTTNFNPLNKSGNLGDFKQAEQAKIMPNNSQKTLNMIISTQQNQFLKPNDAKNKQKGTHPFLKNSMSLTPTKITNDKQMGKSTNFVSKTPPKFIKNVVEAKMHKNSIEEEKKIFKSLNQIIENKNKQKLALQSNRTRKQSKMINGFELGKILGKGKFGEVFLSRHHQTGFVAAIKKISKKKVIQFKMVDQFSKQIGLHSCLYHPNIVRFYGCFEDKYDIYLVMQYMNGGTLFDYLNEVNYMSVKEAVQYLRDIIEALTYMHQKSIAHRDIKPQNIVISSEGVAKLCDFGWSTIVETSRKTYCGTLSYAPPQILQHKNYDTAVDIWSIGVLTYELLTGREPFEGQKRNIVMDKIVNVDKHKLDYSVDIPPQAKQFIQCLIQKDPCLRPKAQDLLKFKLFSLFPSKINKGKKIQ